MQLIDMRARPAWLHDFFGATPGSPGEATARWLNTRMGTQGDAAHFVHSRSLAGFAELLVEANVDRAVVVGRQIAGQWIPNERIAQAVGAAPDRLMGFAGIDTAQSVDDALATIDYAVAQLGLRGINIEPGFDQPPRALDDAAFAPICERCETLGVPLAVMSGPTMPDPFFNDAAAIIRLARRHPQLAIICYHGVYPHVADIVGAALVQPNIYLVPDMYLFAPGGGLYMEAAAGALASQLLFGSSYPFRPIGQSVADAMAMAHSAGLSAAAIDAFFYGNAARLLRL